MMAGRYAHAKQFNRHRRQLRVLRIRLGRLIRDIRRKIAGYADLEATSPRSRLAEDDFARHAPRAIPDLRNPASPQTSFLTGDDITEVAQARLQRRSLIRPGGGTSGSHRLADG